MRTKLNLVCPKESRLNGRILGVPTQKWLETRVPGHSREQTCKEPANPWTQNMGYAMKDMRRVGNIKPLKSAWPAHRESWNL